MVLQGNTKIGMTCQFVVTDGTGQFAGAVGGGVMHGWADYQTLDFHVTLHASLELP